MPNKFTSPTNVPYLNIHEEFAGFINTTTKEFYLSDGFDRQCSYEELQNRQDTLFSFIKSNEKAFDPSSWKAFSIRYLMSDDEYTLDFNESVPADIVAWARKMVDRLYGLYTGAFDQLAKPENILPASLASQEYGFGNVFRYFANKTGNETNSSQENVNSTPAPQQTAERKVR